MSTPEPTLKKSDPAAADPAAVPMSNGPIALGPRDSKSDFESLLVMARDDPSPAKFVALAEAIAQLTEQYEASKQSEEQSAKALQECKFKMEAQSASSMCENAKEFSKCLEMMGYNVDAKFMETTEPAFVATASAKDVLERYGGAFKHLATTISEIYQTGVMAENTLTQATKVAASSDDIRSALQPKKRQRVDDTPTPVSEPSGFVARMLQETLADKA